MWLITYKTVGISFEAAIDHFSFTVSLWMVRNVVLSLVPYLLKTYFQNVLRKIGSLSDIIDFRISCNQQISVEKRTTRAVAENLVYKALKCTYFVRKSQTTHISVCLKKFRRYVIKFMASPSQTLYDIGINYMRPFFFYGWYLLC